MSKKELSNSKTASEVAADDSDSGNDFEREQQIYSYYYDAQKSILQGYIDVAKGAIDRSLQRADFVQKVAAGIGTIYTGVIGISFSLEAGKINFPITGLLPPIFLGLSFFTASIYTSFITHVDDTVPDKSDQLIQSNLDAQRNTFINWCSKTVEDRAEFLQAAVVSMGLGIISLPLPYIFNTSNLPQQTPNAITNIFFLALAIGVILIAATLLLSRLLNKQK